MISEGSASSFRKRNRLEAVVALVLGGFLSACTLPQAAPMVKNLSLANAPASIPITSLSPAIVMETQNAVRTEFPSVLVEASVLDPSGVMPGDSLNISIFESAGGDGVLGSDRNTRTDLANIVVDQTGMIKIPYADRLKVSGLNLEGVRTAVVEKLSKRTLNPQVNVSLVARQDHAVSAQGIVAKPGVYPIDSRMLRLVDLLAAVNVVETNLDLVRLTLRRDQTVGSIRLSDLYADTRQNLALRPRDQIVVSRVRETLTVLGAAGSQGRVEIVSRNFSLIDAIASARGADDNVADPRGVFLFRQDQATGSEPHIYQIDMRNPNDLMLAARFRVRNGDAVYISTAPFAQAKKAITVLATAFNSVRAVDLVVP